LPAGKEVNKMSIRKDFCEAAKAGKVWQILDARGNEFTKEELCTIAKNLLFVPLERMLPSSEAAKFEERLIKNLLIELGPDWTGEGADE
jgi:hypothetical protein